MFSCVNVVVFKQRCFSQFNDCIVKPPKQAHGFICFKRGSIEDVKIVMQIYAYDCKFLNCFYSLSIVLPISRQKSV